VSAVRAKAPDTLVVVLGDHGEMLGEHGIEMSHHGVYEGRDPDSARHLAARRRDVPVHLRQALRRAPDRSSAMAHQVRLMDVPATVLALVGFPAMPQSEGVPLLAAAPVDKDLVSLVVGRMTAKLSDGLVCGYRAGQLKLLGGALYNLYDDRAETTDIAASTLHRRHAARRVSTRGRRACRAAP